MIWLVEASISAGSRVTRKVVYLHEKEWSLLSPLIL